MLLLVKSHNFFISELDTHAKPSNTKHIRILKIFKLIFWMVWISNVRNHSYITAVLNILNLNRYERFITIFGTFKIRTFFWQNGGHFVPFWMINKIAAILSKIIQKWNTSLNPNAFNQPNTFDYFILVNGFLLFCFISKFSL